MVPSNNRNSSLPLQGGNASSSLAGITVTVAQLGEQRFVVPPVTGSIPVSHLKPRSSSGRTSGSQPGNRRSNRLRGALYAGVVLAVSTTACQVVSVSSNLITCSFCGCGIKAITSAFQADNEGSIPFTH